MEYASYNCRKREGCFTTVFIEPRMVESKVALINKKNCEQILKRLNFQILAHSEYKSDKRALVNVLIKHKKTSTNNPKFTIKQHRKIK